MKKLNFIQVTVISVCAFIVCFGWIYHKYSYSTDLSSAYLKHPVEQSATERNWKNIQFEVKAYNPELFNPLSILSFHDTTFLVVDYGDKIIKKFDTSAQKIDQFGKGRGRGPGEAINYIDV